ncbi:MAG: DNA ligase D [Legionella sp.]|nr:MAG: DNA ligase D [Legionella sp.]
MDKPPTNPGWLYEVKFDGYRILAFKKGKKVSLKSRNNIDWTDALSSVAQAIAQLPYTNLILDGEVVVLDKQGHSDFQLLQNSIKAKEPAAFVYFVFDLLYFEQYDLKSLSLIDRKTVLQSLIPKDMPILHFSDHLLEGDDLYQFACKEGLEGVIAKKIDSLYYSKRTKEWLKIKCLKRQEFVVGGYTAPKGNREYFGSLLLGVYNDKNELVYSGNVGTGFNQASLSEIYDQLIANKRTKNPFNTTPADYRHAQWVKPTLVVEVEFTEWTEDGHLRHPSFKGLRLDKKATDVIRETTTPLEKVKPTMKKSPTNKQQLVLSNPQKILYPEDQYTKQDLWDYYEIVSEHILPFLSMRPLTLLRCPEGYNHCFYQRHYNDNTNPALHSIAVKNTDNTEEQYIYLDDTLGLLSLVQMGVLEIHPWGSQKQDLEKPDMIVIDLDPGPDVPWTQVVAAAYEVREHLMQYQLQSFVKSTGGKGLHVVIPIKPEYDWDAVKQFTQVFVQFLEKLKPKEYTSNMSKAKRKGKIYVDYLRNQRTATAIAAYSTRARIHAPVSTPLFWDELSDSIEDNTYTIKTLPQRLKKLKADPWQDFWKIKQSLRLDDLE